MAKDIFKSLENEISVYKDNLIGYYNTNNLYMINPEIIDNLIEYPKVIDKFQDNSIFCSCYLVGFGTLSFQIDVAKDGNNLVSTMYVLENTTRANGYMTASLKTPLVQFVAKEEKDFVQRIIYAFNLTEDSAVLEQPKEDDKSYIFMRKSYNQHMFESIKDDCNKEFKTLVDAQMNYLKKEKNPFTKEVLEKFKDKESSLKDKYLKVGKTIDYFAMYQLLMSCVDSVLKKNPSYDRYYKEYSKNLFVATQFALKAIRSFNTKFRNGAFKKLDAAKTNSITKIANNKEMLNSSTKEKTNTVLKLGDVIEDGCLDSVRQWRGFRRGMRNFHAFQAHEHEERCRICNGMHQGHGSITERMHSWAYHMRDNYKEVSNTVTEMLRNFSNSGHDLGIKLSEVPTGLKEFNERVTTRLSDVLQSGAYDFSNYGQITRDGAAPEFDERFIDNDFEDELDGPDHDID